MEFYPKPPGRPPGGSPGLLWGSGRPVGLEKLVDSMTCKLSPTTKFDLAPSFPEVQRMFSHVSLAVFSRFAVRRSKKVQKTGDNARFATKNAVFPRKNGRFTHPSWTMDGPRYTQASPSECQKNRHSQAKLALPRPRNLATDPQVGPTGLWHQEDVICNPPAPMVKEVYRDRITP